MRTDSPPGSTGIAAQIRNCDITHMQCTPSLARLLALNRECLESMGSLRKSILGGEALSPALLNQLRPAVRADIFNLDAPHGNDHLVVGLRSARGRGGDPDRPSNR